MMALLRDDLIHQLIGREAEEIGGIWRDLMFSIHALVVGPIASLALAAIDIALWDLRCMRAQQPLYRMLGGAKKSIPMYTTSTDSPENVAKIVKDKQAQGYPRLQIKVGGRDIEEDIAVAHKAFEARDPG